MVAKLVNYYTLGKKSGFSNNFLKINLILQFFSDFSVLFLKVIIKVSLILVEI